MDSLAGIGFWTFGGPNEPFAIFFAFLGVD